MESLIDGKYDVDLQATCASLGYTDENGIYQREPDCLESVKDLIRFMKRDDELCHIRRQLGSAAILQTDLIPILKQIGTFFLEIQHNETELRGKDRLKREKKTEEERVLLETVIRLVVNLTQPARLCFGDKVPDKLAARQSFIEIESYLQKYKEAFVDEALFSVLSQKLGTLLNLDWEARQEEDRLLIERILLLVRNILQVPPDVKSELRTDDDASLHDQILWSLHVSGFNDLLLYLANSGEERHLILHVVEILSLMLREQTPDHLASCGVARAKSEKEKDKKELEEILDTEAQKKKISMLRAGSRHSTFGGTYTLENMKSISDRDVIVHRPPAMKMDVHGLRGSCKDVDKSENAGKEGKSLMGMFNVDLDKRKSGRRKPKNRMPISEAELLRRSTYAVRSMLKEFCIQFLESCYNPVMRAVKDALIRSKAQQNDESYYLRILTFMMQFNRKQNFRPALVSETLSNPTFHYVTTQLEKFYEMTQTEKKEAVMWSKRMHLALKSFRELLECVEKMDQSAETQIKESSRVIKSNIFYTMEYRDILLLLIKKYDNTRQSKLFLRDLLETNHLFMRMLECFCRDNKNLVVQRKKKKLIRRKSKPNKHTEESTIAPTIYNREKVWDDISEEVTQILQGQREVPRDVMPFDAASDIDIDQQGVEAVRTIHECLKKNRPGEAVALFRSAREVWPEKVEFKISSDAPEDEFLSLREICLLNFPESEDNARIDEEDSFSEEEENQGFYENMEQSFSFKEFIMRYASPLVVKSCVAFLEDFKSNSSSSNHCALKLLHRVGFDCGAVAILFQLSLFNIFRKLFTDPTCHMTKQFAELKTFAVHVTRRFTEQANTDKKMIIEMLFWKSAKEAMHLTDEDGGKNMSDSKTKNGWSDQQEEELKYLFEEVKSSEQAEPPKDKKSYQPDIVDRIIARMSDQSKTRRQVLKQMVTLDLISSVAEVKNKTRRAHGWTEEELDYLKEIVPLSLEGQDPMKEIMTSYKDVYGGMKGRNALRKKIIELGLSRGEGLKKKARSSKGNKKRDKTSKYEGDDRKEVASDDDDDETQNDESVDEHEDDDDDDDDVNSETASDNLQVLDKDLIRKLKCKVETKSFLLALPWIQTKLEIVARDREDEESISMPLVPITEDQEDAMIDETFTSLLLACGLKKPSSEQETFWRIPSNLSSGHLHEVVTILSEESPQGVEASSACKNDDYKKEEINMNGEKIIRRAIDSDSEEEEHGANNIDDEGDSDDEKLIIDDGNDGNEINTAKGSKRKLEDFSSDDEDLQDDFPQPLIKKARRLLESDDEEDIVKNNSRKIIDSDDD